MNSLNQVFDIWIILSTLFTQVKSGYEKTTRFNPGSPFPNLLQRDTIQHFPRSYWNVLSFSTNFIKKTVACFILKKAVLSNREPPVQNGRVGTYICRLADVYKEIQSEEKCGLILLLKIYIFVLEIQTLYIFMIHSLCVESTTY